MAKTRELRRRVRSVEKTRQITKTMEMVATSRLKRSQDRVVGARPYAQALGEVLGDLLAPEFVDRFPLLRQPKGTPKRVALIGVTSNRGLCGAFNANLIREMRARMAELEGAGTTVELHLIGRKGIGFFRFLRREIAAQRTDIGDRPTPQHAEEIVTPLMARYAAGELDGVEVVFARFVSPLSTPPTRLPVLPLRAPDRAGRRVPYYILRPGPDALLDALVPLFLRNQVYRALVETAASEQGARRTAMKNATDNAGDMIDTLRRSLNRARQAQITQELAEIVGGAEAQKG